MKKTKKKNDSSDNGQYWFDEESAQRAVDFFAEYLTHVKGEKAGEPFILSPWQQEQIIRPLFGWKRQDGTRKYRTAYIEIPRKMGKSTLCAGIGLILTFADHEEGAEVYSAAADRDQAAIVFEVAKQMVEMKPALKKRAAIFRRSIVVEATRSSYKVLSADAYTKHGLNAHGIIFDELHAQPNRELWDVLTTSTGARRQPLVVAITTAGFDRQSICWEIHDYACKVRDGIVEDAAFLPVIYAADEKDDWTDPAVWHKANPGLGVSVKLEYFEQEVRKARETPAYENTFRRLHLNQWTEQSVRWLPMEKWDECDLAPVHPDTLLGRACYGGLDLSSTTDLSSLVLLFPPTEEEDFYTALSFFWVPAENIDLRARRDHVDYRTWVKTGAIEATEGNVVDQDYIRQRVRALGERYEIKEIAIDRWNSTQLQTQLQGDGFTIVQFGQGFASMSAPTKELLALVLSQRLNHGGNPVLRWQAANVAAKTDSAGNIKPDKEKSTERIDGIVALIMALGRAMVRPEDSASVYETRGILALGSEE